MESHTVLQFSRSLIVRNCFGLVLFLVFCFEQASSQDSLEYFVFTDLSSHLRGNASLNLSGGMKHNRLFHTIGFDYIYNIRSPERKNNSGKISYGLNYKLTYKLDQSENSHVNIGANFKYGNFNILQLDADVGDSWTEKEWIFERNYNKITSLAVLEILGKHDKLFWGFQMGLGVAHIFGVNQSKVGRFNGSTYMGISQTEANIDFSYLGEHGYYRNDSALDRVLAFQMNILVGYLINQ